MSILLDILIAGLFAAAVAYGVKKGFVRMITSLLGSVGAFFLARFTAGMLTPMIYESFPIGDVISVSTSSATTSAAATASASAAPTASATAASSAAAAQTVSGSAGTSAGAELAGFPSELIDFLTKTCDSVRTEADTVTDTINRSVKYATAYVIIFLISFIVFLLLIWFISVILDGMAKLPVVHAVNKLAGAVFALLAGFVVIWSVCSLANWLMPLLDPPTGGDAAKLCEGSVIYSALVSMKPFTLG